METHRYFRPQSGGGVRKEEISLNFDDRYDVDIRCSCVSPMDNTVEYFTNGQTTLFFGASPPSSSQLSSPTTATPSFDPRASAMATNSATVAPPTKTSTKEHGFRSETTANDVMKHSIIAGSIAGVCSTALCYPFEMLRVKMQQAPLHHVPVTSLRSGGFAMVTPSSAGGGVAGTIRYTLQYGGVRAFYAGMSLPLAAQAFYKATVWTVNNLTHHALVDWKTRENYKLGNFQPYKVTLADTFFCGFIGGAVNGALFVTPVEFVRNQAISQQRYPPPSSINPQPRCGRKGVRAGSSAVANRRLGVISIIRNTLQSDGVIGFWRGLGPTVIRDSIGCGCFFTAMTLSKQMLNEMQGLEEGSAHTSQASRSTVVISGGIAGLAFWLWSLPLDTMKTWIQDGRARNLRHAIELSQKSGFWKGIPLLFRGWQVAYGRGIPAAAISVTGFTYVYDSLNETVVD